ncbi:DUF1189 family protein [Allofustis seminis]|uniref:DUF1189 family protein n=1 Tax=Allofustis seminis TaxID=166939 RepID=UPI000370A446|nr:DUF1189 family protein [Allofustis seminis]
MLNFLKIAYLNPQEIYRGRNITKKMMILFIVLLNLITALGYAIRLAPDFIQLNKDAQIISNHVPNFEIDSEKKQLISDAEGFSYQTSSLLFFFDPNDQVTSQEVEYNHKSLNPQVTIALHEKELDVLLSNNAVHYRKNYASLPDFSHAIFINILHNVGQFNLRLILVIVSIAFIITLLFTILYLWISSLFGQSIALFMGIRLKFSQSLKMALLASFIPTSIVAVATAFVGTVPYGFELCLIFTAFLMKQSLNNMKDKMIKNQKL